MRSPVDWSSAPNAGYVGGQDRSRPTTDRRRGGVVFAGRCHRRLSRPDGVSLLGACAEQYAGGDPCRPAACRAPLGPCPHDASSCDGRVTPTGGSTHRRGVHNGCQSLPGLSVRRCRSFGRHQPALLAVPLSWVPGPVESGQPNGTREPPTNPGCKCPESFSASSARRDRATSRCLVGLRVRVGRRR